MKIEMKALAAGDEEQVNQGVPHVDRDRTTRGGEPWVTHLPKR